MVGMLTSHLELKMKSKTECPFLIYIILVKVKHLPRPSTVSPPLVEFIHILTAFYYAPISFVLFIHSLIDASR